MKKGFTLVELLLTMGVVAILATISTISLVNYRSQKTLDLQTQEIVSVLRDTQNRSITQENGKPWGVHFKNLATSSGYYSLFANSTYNDSSIVSTTTLNSAVEFLDPAIGDSTDVAFSAITGRPTASSSITIALKSDSSISRTITISQNGLIAWSEGGGGGETLSIPSAPQSLSATPGNTQIVLNWSAPSSNGGSSITNYKVYRGTSSGSETLLTTLGNVLTYTNTGLTNGTTYYYKVSVVNTTSEGSQSSEASATPVAPSTVPSAPQSLTATPGNTQIVLNWSAPSSNGGLTITNYKVYRGTTSGGETLLTTLGNVLTYTNTSLTNGTTYYYKVSAVNSVGEGTLSSEVSATPVTPATVPSAPQSLAATPGNTQIVLNWSAPSSNGGSTITGYKVYRGTTSGSETLLTTLGNVLTYTNTSLTNGTTYYYKVSAVNATGEGSQSTEASATPSAPFCTVDGDKDTHTTINGDVIYCDNSLRMWTPTADIGGSATTYTWGGDGTDEPTNSCIGIANRPACNYCDNLFYVGFNDWQLPTKDVLASFWITACGGACYENARIAWDTNAYGTVEYWSSTEYSNPASAWYMGSENNMTIMNKYNVAYVRCVRGQLVTPSAPQNLTATAGNAQVVLNWSAPSSNGGLTITNYKVYRGTTSGGETLFTTLDNVLTYTNTSLTNGTTYYYKVSAVNSVGESSQSNEASATPTAPVTYTSVYPPAHNTTYVKATFYYENPNPPYTYYPYYATDPTKSLTGEASLNEWGGYAAGSPYYYSGRFHIDLGSAKIVTRIYYENSHDNAQLTLNGVKNFTFWGSNTAGDFADLIYNDNRTWVQLTTAQSTFDQHVNADQLDPKYIVVTNATAYRYYAFKFYYSWGSTWMGVRRIELQVTQ